jgi:hypothetical protein
MSEQNQDDDKRDLGPYKPGRPRKYDTVEEMEAIIDEYFEYCDNKTKEIESEKLGTMIMPDPQPYTMSGLALELGLSRQGMLDYKSRKDTKGKDFLDAIKSARSRVEADVERRMMGKDTFTPGLIFSAKNNFAWADKSTVDGTQEIIVTTRKHKNGSKSS